MSILIKGMEMPKSCWDCPCYHHRVDDGYYDYEICRASGTVFNDGYASVTGHKTHIDPFKQRLDNCPLIPVPPHGDLIDRDALIKEQEITEEDDHNGATLLMAVFLEVLKSAPTIIQASKEVNK